MSNSPAKRTVILGVTGSIAAYKSAEIASLLRKAGHEVFVVMTRSAAEFITPLTLATLSRNPVLRDLSEEQEGGWKPGHIELADRADLLLVAPASADSIARLANGFADDALGAVALVTRERDDLRTSRRSSRTPKKFSRRAERGSFAPRGVQKRSRNF